MAFSVEISPQAFRDLDDLAIYLLERSQSRSVARKWFLSVLDSIDSLSTLPERHPVVALAEPDVEIVRLLTHGRRNRKYKIYYCVRKRSPSSGIVSVFHIRHWARRPVSANELQALRHENL